MASLGVLTFTCCKGNGYRYEDVSQAQAQMLLNERFDDPVRCTVALFSPHGIAMTPAPKNL
jgi:hypothetical protein